MVVDMVVEGVLDMVVEGVGLVSSTYLIIPQP
jgi:hypothetical protein